MEEPEEGSPDEGIYHALKDSGRLITNPKKFIKRIPFTDSRILGVQQSGMYYVYIQTVGEPATDTPCCCFKDLTIGCAINHCPVYHLLLKLICAFEDRCMVAEDKILDIYLKKQLITQAVDVSDYVMANKIFRELYQREIHKGSCLDACNSTFDGSSVSGFKNCTTC